MGTVVVALRDPQSAESSIRCEALAAFTGRLRALTDDDTQLVEGPEDSANAIRRLADAAWGVGDGDTVSYIPSREGRRRGAGGGGGGGASAIALRHGKMVRRSPGVLYRFPLEPEAAGLPGSPVAAAGDVAE